MNPLWECDDCDRYAHCAPLAGDDWGGVPKGIGPDCPECDCPMTPAACDCGETEFVGVGRASFACVKCKAEIDW